MLGVAVLFLLLLVPYMLMLRPQSEEISVNDGEIVRLQQENDLFQRKIDELTAEGADDLSDEEIAQVLPTVSNQEQIVNDLYKVGVATSVRLSDATFSNENTAASQTDAGSQASVSGQVRSVYVTVNIQGSYDGIKNWMSEIQNLPRLTAVEQFRIDKPYVYRGTLLSATVTFTASYLPQAASPADPAEVPAS